MILFCGIPSDPSIDLAVQAAENFGIAYKVLDQRKFDSMDISIDIKNGSLNGELFIDGVNYSLNDFDGIYTRRIDWRHLVNNQTSLSTEQELKAQYFHTALEEWIELADCKVLNKNAAMSSNTSKPYQAQIIAKCGFLTPPTLITNSPEQVKEFWKQHKRVIYKSISLIRSIVKELQPEDLTNLDKIKYLPTQFQAFVPGSNIRVHVVGKDVFATKISTDSTDYRYAETEEKSVQMQHIDLPEGINKRLVLLSEMLELRLCGVDLKITPDNKVYCFEVNPSPAYSYYEQQTGQPIAQSIVKYLDNK